MVLILLVSTLHFSIYKMDCLMSGNTQISLSDFEDCNEPQKDDNSIAQRCCNFHEVTFNFDYDTDVNLKGLTSFAVPVIRLAINSNSVESNPTTDFNFYTNLPPPSGIELLKVVQVFRL